MSNDEDKQLRDGDYYFDENGLMVLTAQYLKRRGYCCKNGCRHCPYGFIKNDKSTDGLIDPEA